MSLQPVAEAATCSHNRRTYVPLAGFELAIPAIERLQTSALDRAATGIAGIFA